MEVFRFFLPELTNFLFEAYFLGVEKNDILTLLWKFQNGPFWPKLTQILPKFCQNEQNPKVCDFDISLRKKRLEVERPREAAC